MRIDHVILAVADLRSAAASLFARTGLAALPGGVHPAWGTENMIVPLGGAYLELVAVADPAVAAGTVFGRLVAAGAGLVGWAVEPDDFDAATRRAGVDAQRGARKRPDGGMLSWSMAGADEALPRGLPFLLRWDTPETDPAHDTAAHRTGIEPTGIAWIEIEERTAATLPSWLGRHDLDLRTIPDGSPRRAAVALRDGGGEIVVPAT